MAKFYNAIGYVIPVNDTPGVWRADVEPTEIFYYGDIYKNSLHFQNGTDLNSDMTLNKTVSIIADSFAMKNHQYMRYVIHQGIKWAITSVDPDLFPRMTITIGGIYNGG